MKYTTRGLRRRGDSDTWEVILSHKDPLSGDIVPSHHTVTGRTPFRPDHHRRWHLDAGHERGRLRPKSCAKASRILKQALTTGMRRGEVCALRWGDLSDDGIVTIRRALGNGKGGFYEKEPKTSSSARTIPLTDYTFKVLTAIRKDRRLACMEMGVPFGDPYMLGTLGEDARPYNPTMLSKDFTAFAKMNNFDCSFHDLRHTFATMLIAEGVDVRATAIYLGHASVSMTLDIYADVDPDAKKAAVGKIEEAFGTGDSFAATAPMPNESRQPRFTSTELRTMLDEAERREDA